MPGKNRSSASYIKLSGCLDLEVSKISCFQLYPCNSHGVANFDTSCVSSSPEETEKGRNKRKVQVARTIREGKFLPLELGIQAGMVRLRCSPLQPDEEAAWIGQVAGRLDLTTGFFFIHDRIIEVVPNYYRIDAYCCLPSEAATKGLAAFIDEWNSSLALVDNLKTWWRTSQRAKCPWNNRSLKRSVALILQLTPEVGIAKQSGRSNLQFNHANEFFLNWKYRKIHACPHPVDGADWSLLEGESLNGLDEGKEECWQFDVQEATGRQGKKAAPISKPRSKKKDVASAKPVKPNRRAKSTMPRHPVSIGLPRFPLLFAQDGFQLFRAELVSRVQQAIEEGAVDMTRIVPRLTAAMIKEFDDIAEDSALNDRFLLVIACVQIECGLIEQWVAADALRSIANLRNNVQVVMDKRNRQKFSKELNMLEEDIRTFSE